jgi:hypothetical protein
MDSERGGRGPMEHAVVLSLQRGEGEGGAPVTGVHVLPLTTTPAPILTISPKCFRILSTSPFGLNTSTLVFSQAAIRRTWN